MQWHLLNVANSPNGSLPLSACQPSPSAQSLSVLSTSWAGSSCLCNLFGLACSVQVAEWRVLPGGGSGGAGGCCSGVPPSSITDLILCQILPDGHEGAGVGRPEPCSGPFCPQGAVPTPCAYSSVSWCVSPELWSARPVPRRMQGLSQALKQHPQAVLPEQVWRFACPPNQAPFTNIRLAAGMIYRVSKEQSPLRPHFWAAAEKVVLLWGWRLKRCWGWWGHQASEKVQRKTKQSGLSSCLCPPAEPPEVLPAEGSC